MREAGLMSIDKKSAKLIKRAVMDRLNLWIRSPDTLDINIDMKAGLDRVDGVDGYGKSWATYKHNGTETVIIRRNGGAQDGDRR